MTTGAWDWVQSHADQVLAYLFGSAGIGWKLWDLHRQREKDDLDETSVLSLEWRQLRNELREEISKLRQRLTDQETALESQRQKIYEVTATNQTLRRKNKEQAGEINHLEDLLARLTPPRALPPTNAPDALRVAEKPAERPEETTP